MNKSSENFINYVQSLVYLKNQMTKGCAMTNEEVKERIEELSKDFGVDESIVWALYDIMPNELYDGIVTALEDYSNMIF